MKGFSAIFRRESRPRPDSARPRKRPARTPVMSFASLESRALLATMALNPAPSATQSLAAAFANPSSPIQLLITSAYLPSTGGTSGGGHNWSPNKQTGSPSHAGGGSPPPQAQGGNAASDSGLTPSQDPRKGHIALAEANVLIDGTLTPEFALADAAKSTIYVELGLNGQSITLGPSDGVNAPQSVTLADVNGDGLPDLIVANTGGNNVLVFPGLAGGLFGPEVNGEKGFAVGKGPVSVTVGDVNGDGNPDLVVASSLSNTVTILDGQGSGSSWTATVGETIQVGPDGSVTAPVKTALVDVNGDGNPDLFVCNSVSDNVYLFLSQGDGAFDTADPTVFGVGSDPSEMLVGRFDKLADIDVLTVNSESNNLTFIGGALTHDPTSMTLPSGGTFPDAAFAIDPNHNGVMDVVVANSGDGHLALFQGTNDGMQIVGVITQAGNPGPTGLAPAGGNQAGIDFLAADAGEDVAQLFHFDLTTVSTFLANPDESSGIDESGDELIAQLVAYGESGLELIAVLGTGSPDSEALSGEWGPRESSMVTALYSPTEGQGTEANTTTSESPHDPNRSPTAPTDPSQVDSSLWARFVFGLDAALEEPLRVVEAVAARDAREPGDEPSMGNLVRLDQPPSDPGIEAAFSTVDEALRLFWSEGRGEDGGRTDETSPRFDPIRDLDGIDAPALDGRLDTVPLISSALILSTRLILKASPPRPPSFRKGAGRQGVKDRPAGGDAGGLFDRKVKK